MNGPTSDELHSPEETPVLGAMMLLTIFALQLASVCSQRRLCEQLEPDSNSQPHWRIEWSMVPFHTLCEDDARRLLARMRGAAQNRTALQRAVQEVSVRPNEHGVDERTVLDERIRTEEIGVGLDGVTGWNGGSDCTGSCPVRRTRSDPFGPRRADHCTGGPPPARCADRPSRSPC